MTTHITKVRWNGARLHLACGAKYLPGWVNADAVAAPIIQDVVGNPDVVLDITQDLDLIPEGALVRVYWSHGPEHIAPDLLPQVFAHLHRALVPSGRLTIATTDLLKIVTQRYPDDNWEGPLFGHRRSTDAPWLAHLDCFSSEKLTRLLRAAGFATVRPWDLGEYPELMALRDYATTHADVSLYVEAVR